MATVPYDEGISSKFVFHTMSEKDIPNISEIDPNIKLINFVSGFLKQYS